MALPPHKRSHESSISTGSGEEGGQHPNKRPASSTSKLQNPEINGSTGHLTKDVIREVVAEEIKQLTPTLKELVETCIQNELKGIIPQIVSSLKNAFQDRVHEGTDHPSPHSFKPVKRPVEESTRFTNTRNLQLQFDSKLPLFFYTTTPLKSQPGGPLLVTLIDANTDKVVTSGPESCAKLDVVVLEGDCYKEDGNTLSGKDFAECILKERDKKQLIDKQSLKLKNGIGDLGDLTFNDNSSWTRSRKFRIGVRVASDFCEGIRIREGITDAFIVKEYRGEAYQKHYPPKFDDVIWRLEEIAKDGPNNQKLNHAGIYKVEDFMRFLFADPEELHRILAGMPRKRWEALKDHAKTCEPDGQSYVYYDEMKDFGVVISNLCQFEGFITDEVHYPEEQLPRHQKALADDLVKAASKNWNHVKVFDPAAFNKEVGEEWINSLLQNEDVPASFGNFGTESSFSPQTGRNFTEDTTAGLGNGNHDHDVGINRQSSIQSHIRNSTGSIGSEQETSGQENVQSPVPHPLPAPDGSFWERLIALPDDCPVGQILNRIRSP